MRYANEILNIDNKSCKQINKTVAAKEFNKGKTIYLHPCNMRLSNRWTSPMPIDNNSNTWYADSSFESIVKEYQYHNCIAEAGNYVNFFIEIN